MLRPSSRCRARRPLPPSSCPMAASRGDGARSTIAALVGMLSATRAIARGLPAIPPGPSTRSVLETRRRPSATQTPRRRPRPTGRCRVRAAPATPATPEQATPSAPGPAAPLCPTRRHRLWPPRRPSPRPSRRPRPRPTSRLHPLPTRPRYPRWSSRDHPSPPRPPRRCPARRHRPRQLRRPSPPPRRRRHPRPTLRPHLRQTRQLPSSRMDHAVASLPVGARGGSARAAHPRAEGLRTLTEGTPRSREVRFGIHYDVLGAALSALRTIIAVGLGSVFWRPGRLERGHAAAGAAGGLHRLARHAAEPVPGSGGAALALPLPAIVVGVVGFVLLPLVSGYGLFTLTIAPAVMLFCLVARHPRTAPLGTVMLLFFTLLLGPSNPQSFDLAASSTTWPCWPSRTCSSCCRSG
ncbi:MAG: FUSC family protein [Acetobacteraceae bacterium]